jgi:hypothetical protein
MLPYFDDVGCSLGMAGLTCGILLYFSWQSWTHAKALSIPITAVMWQGRVASN